MDGHDCFEKIVTRMLVGTDAEGLRFGEYDRDLRVMTAFLNNNLAHCPIQLNDLTPELSVPGQVFLLDSLRVESNLSRYRYPCSVFLDELSGHRGVDWTTLQKVVCFFLY